MAAAKLSGDDSHTTFDTLLSSPIGSLYQSTSLSSITEMGLTGVGCSDSVGAKSENTVKAFAMARL